jgi:hypothetical protein
MYPRTTRLPISWLRKHKKVGRTEPTLCPSGWYTPPTLNLEVGILDHVLRPCSINSHSFCGLVAEPENLHPMPTTATWSEAQACPGVVKLFSWPLCNYASKYWLYSDSNNGYTPIELLARFNTALKLSLTRITCGWVNFGWVPMRRQLNVLSKSHVVICKWWAIP